MLERESVLLSLGHLLKSEFKTSENKLDVKCLLCAFKQKAVFLFAFFFLTIKSRSLAKNKKKGIEWKPETVNFSVWEGA